MFVKGGDSGWADGGNGNHVGHTGSDVGSASSSSLAHLEAFNLNVITGANAQQIALDASQSTKIVDKSGFRDDGSRPDGAPSDAGNIAAAGFGGTAVAVDGTGNNNDGNSVLSFNSAFDHLVNMPGADVDHLDGTLSMQGVLQVLSGGGNQFENDQIQNIVDNDCVNSHYTFGNEVVSAHDGGATGFTMTVIGGDADGAAGGNHNTTGFDGSAVGSAASAATAHLEAFNQNIIMGANFQSEALTHTQTTEHIDIGIG
jgi:hypothetical protein